MTFNELFEKHEPQIRAAFLAAIDDITSQAQINRIVEALERGDINAAIDALYLDREAYAEFEAALEAAFGEGGRGAIEELGLVRDQQGQRTVIRFGYRNTAAEQWLREYSSSLVTRIVADQQTAVRNRLTEGLEQGNNPRSTALDIVGRIDRRTGKRTGGIVGLTAPQERAVAKARDELLNGEYGAYLNREKRDRRFDRMVMAAKRDGKQLTKAQIDKMLQRYSDRLLKLRGDTIARTETLTSLNRSKYEAVKQLIENGTVTPNQVTLMWDAANDTRTRIDHLIADKQLVKWGETFNVGGRQMKYPGDPAGGADQVINCRCNMRVKINYGSNL